MMRCKTNLRAATKEQIAIKFYDQMNWLCVTRVLDELVWTVLRHLAVQSNNERMRERKMLHNPYANRKYE